MSKVRCAACREYLEKEQAISSGIQNFCTIDCVRDYQRSSGLSRRKEPVKPNLRNNRRRAKNRIPVDVRDKVLERDRFRCRFCAAPHNLQLHHIIYRSQGGKHEESNLITLCSKHHRLVHSSKQRWMHVLLGVVWMTYWGRWYQIPVFERKLQQEQLPPPFNLLQSPMEEV